MTYIGYISGWDMVNRHAWYSPMNDQMAIIKWAASSKFGTYRLCEQRRFKQACAYAQSRQNLHYSLIQAVSQEEPSDRKPDPWPLWMTGHAQLKFVMTECWKTQIRLTGLKYQWISVCLFTCNTCSWEEWKKVLVERIVNLCTVFKIINSMMIKHVFSLTVARNIECTVKILKFRPPKNLL